MLASSHTGSVAGIKGQIVRVEVDVSSGFPGLVIVGLPDSAVRESENRIKAAIRNSSFEFSWDRRITINLAPAHLRKTGSAFDLAIATALLATSGGPAARGIFLGELALDGAVRGVPGVLPILIEASARGFTKAVVPVSNLAEASLVAGLTVRGVASLADAIHPDAAPLASPPCPPTVTDDHLPDLRDVQGQSLARRALEIAAAGRHNLLMVGPPGSGKTMLARRLPGLLPGPDGPEALEMTAIQSAAGLAPHGLVTSRPFRAPHHTASAIALAGGGTIPRPGEVSLAHGGVLFLDELPEFPRSTLEGLRQPLEEGRLTVSRARATYDFPARFQFVAAMNPCPCGYRGDPVLPCRCTPVAVARYQSRISGPLLDRIDLIVDVPRPEIRLRVPDTISRGESTRTVRERVERARRFARSIRRSGGEDVLCRLRLDDDALSTLEKAARAQALSLRAVHRVARVARTIANLAEAELVRRDAVLEALIFRAGTVLTPSQVQ